MNVIKLYGGLGNQMFQYALGLAMENRGIEVAFENSFFHKEQSPPRPYGLAAYGIDLKLSPFLNQPTIHEKGYDINILNKTNCNFFGYWQYFNYYESIWEKVRGIFKVSSKYYTEQYLELQKRITKTESLSIHVRRGDYVTIPGHVVLPFSYYIEAAGLIPEAKEIFVFSDDIPWCKERFKESYFDKPITFVDIEEYLALDLMRQCKHNVIANSTFSWWAAMLTNNTFQKVVAPKIWRVNSVEQAKMEDDSFIPNDWIRL
jgi:hypothetical protein